MDRIMTKMMYCTVPNAENDDDDDDDGDDDDDDG